MGRGDLRTRKGKIFRGTKGKTHQKKRRVDIGKNKKAESRASK
ncbi:MAG: 30S ribosomal protein THX [Calditrichaceae bacterium]|nr:30S ribosomal protein THX [Calditrichaceae bacterium]